MPNWCENTLSIKGTNEQIVDFNKRYLPNGIFSFENIIPSPQTIEECPEDYILHNEEEANKHCLLWDPTQPRNWFNWYDWNCHYWGCKWDATVVSIEQNEESIKIFFETPWSPSIPVIAKLIEDNPQLEIECEYFEPGMWFAGTITKEGLKELSAEEMEKMYPEWCEPVEE